MLISGVSKNKTFQGRKKLIFFVVSLSAGPYLERMFSKITVEVIFVPVSYSSLEFHTEQNTRGGFTLVQRGRALCWKWSSEYSCFPATNSLALPGLASSSCSSLWYYPFDSTDCETAGNFLHSRRGMQETLPPIYMRSCRCCRSAQDPRSIWRQQITHSLLHLVFCWGSYKRSHCKSEIQQQEEGPVAPHVEQHQIVNTNIIVWLPWDAHLLIWCKCPVTNH